MAFVVCCDCCCSCCSRLIGLDLQQLYRQIPSEAPAPAGSVLLVSVFGLTLDLSQLTKTQMDKEGC